MLTNNMTLRKMIDFQPSTSDMAVLPLDVTVYLRITIISLQKEDNYNFIRHLFTAEDIKDYLKDIEKTIIYDFDGKDTRQERVVTVFEGYAYKNYFQTSEYLKEILEQYDHVADVLIDFFTHDDKKYRLSNLDGIVKLEEYH